jgi:1D-myo-inositol-tetrakisphosphate 5-kinase/inositol-polyphosphate multikinase
MAQSSPAPSDGSLADPTGTLFIKPCTPAETRFYEDAARDHPALAALMPRHLGTLDLAPPALADAVAGASSAAEPHAEQNGAPPPSDGSTELEHAHNDHHERRQQRQQGGPVEDIKHQPLRLMGLPLRTTTHLVLANAAAGLARPSVLDVKLGTRLWAPDAPEPKRARLDAVAAASTSGSLGFRIAGMRVWLGDATDDDEARCRGGGDAVEKEEEEEGKEDPEDDVSRLERVTNTRFFHKMYGRGFSDATVIDGLREFLRPSPFPRPPSPTASSPTKTTTTTSTNGGIGSKGSSGNNLLDARMAAAVAALFAAGVEGALRVLERTELRVFSGSLLFAYESDARAFAARERALAERAARDEAAAAAPPPTASSAPTAGGAPLDGSGRGEDEGEERDDEDEDEDDDEEEEEDLTLATVKLIDFAHARFAPGEGPDENVLHGVRSLLRVLEALRDELEARAREPSSEAAPA